MVSFFRSYFLFVFLVKMKTNTKSCLVTQFQKFFFLKRASKTSCFEKSKSSFKLCLPSYFQKLEKCAFSKTKNLKWKCKTKNENSKRELVLENDTKRAKLLIRIIKFLLWMSNLIQNKMVFDKFLSKTSISIWMDFIFNLIYKNICIKSQNMYLDK